MGSTRIVRTDAAVLEKASEGFLGAEFRRLAEGDDSVAKDRKSADARYLARLALCGADEEQIVRIWRASNRWDDDWCSNVHYVNDAVKLAVRTNKTYRSREELKGDQSKVAKAIHEGEQFERACLEATSPPAVKAKAEEPKPAKKTSSAAPTIVFRKASQIKASVTRWFIAPWIFMGELILVVGGRGLGKSTFISWIIKHARSAVLLPGTEGSVDGMVIPRLVAQGVDLDRVAILDSEGLSMPTRYNALLEQMLAVKADLLVVDPADDFVDPGICINSENVRTAIKCFQRVAQATGAAVIIVRNPGKNNENVCRNNTAWGDVPRRVIQLMPGGGFPPRSILTCYKPGKGAAPPPCYYDLIETGPEAAPVFKMGEPVEASETELALTVPDRMERKKVDEACDIIKAALSDGEKEAGWLLEKGRNIGIMATTMRLARDRLGVTMRSDGGGLSMSHFWCPPEKWPDGSPIAIAPSVFPDPPHSTGP